MQKSTDGRNHKKAAPIICALVVLIPLALILAILVFPLLRESMSDTMAAIFITIYVLCILAVMGGIVAALVQRLREIKGGEEEEAKKY